MDTLQDLHPRREKSNVPESQRCRSCQDNQPSSSVRPHASGDSENRSINQCIRSGGPVTVEWGDKCGSSHFGSRRSCFRGFVPCSLCFASGKIGSLIISFFSGVHGSERPRRSPQPQRQSRRESSWNGGRLQRRSETVQVRQSHIPFQRILNVVQFHQTAFRWPRRRRWTPSTKQGKEQVCLRLAFGWIRVPSSWSVRAVGLLRSTQNSTVFRRKGSSVQQNSQRVCRVWIRAEAGCSWRPVAI